MPRSIRRWQCLTPTLRAHCSAFLISGSNFSNALGAQSQEIGRIVEAIDDIAEVIAHAADSPVLAARQKGISVYLRNEEESSHSELNVIGHNVDDATRALEKFLDRAFLAGLSRVRVVHGSGMGILRRALRQYLQSHPQVASVSEPPQQEGGGGATVVELKV